MTVHLGALLPWPRVSVFALLKEHGNPVRSHTRMATPPPPQPSFGRPPAPAARTAAVRRPTLLSSPSRPGAVYRSGRHHRSASGSVSVSSSVWPW